MPFSSKNCFPINGPQGKEIRERYQFRLITFFNGKASEKILGGNLWKKHLKILSNQGKKFSQKKGYFNANYCSFVNSHDLENRIKSYNLSNWDFRGLHDFFKYHLDEEGDAAKQFFETIIPKMVDLMMKTKELILQPLPMLKAGTSGSITLSQLQVFEDLENLKDFFMWCKKLLFVEPSLFMWQYFFKIHAGCCFTRQRIFLYFSKEKCQDEKR